MVRRSSRGKKEEVGLGGRAAGSVLTGGGNLFYCVFFFVFFVFFVLAAPSLSFGTPGLRSLLWGLFISSTQSWALEERMLRQRPEARDLVRASERSKLF